MYYLVAVLVLSITNTTKVWRFSEKTSNYFIAMQFKGYSFTQQLISVWHAMLISDILKGHSIIKSYIIILSYL